tara:strand:- start:1144 stop:1824 length:681 start_codon:yes stop_codon:yes gene_type:complete
MYKTYVMHYTPLEARRKFIDSQLAKMDITNVEFITQFDREELTEEILDKHYNQDMEAHRNACAISMRGERYKYEEMSPPSISLNMKHLTAFKKLANQKEKFGLFIEDDCRFCDGKKTIDSIIDSSPPNWDVMVVGGAFDHKICDYRNSFTRSQHTYLYANHPATNTTSSILYKKESAAKILPHMEAFCLPIDWQLNHAFHEAKLNVYHTYPYLCTQGDFRSTAKDE